MLLILGIIIAATIIFILFLVLNRTTKIIPYIATYQVDTTFTFGDITNYQNEKIIISHLDGRYKSEHFVNDIALLKATYNTPDGGFIFCSQNEAFDCQRLGDALSKNVGRPPKIDGLQKSSPIAQQINIAGIDRSCHETTYTLPAATDKNAFLQKLTATVCIDDELKIPLIAILTVDYRINDITQYRDLNINQTRTLTELDLTPSLSPSDFAAP